MALLFLGLGLTVSLAAAAGFCRTAPAGGIRDRCVGGPLRRAAAGAISPKGYKFPALQREPKTGLWADLKQQLTGLEHQDQGGIERVIRVLASKQGLRLLVDSQKETEALAAAGKALAVQAVASGKWRFYRLENLKR